MVTRLNYTDLSIIILNLPPSRGQGQISAYVYILLCECVFPCWTPTAACISSVNVCFHAVLPQSLYILLCPCWTPTELVYPLVNVCFHAGLPQSLSVIRLYEKEGFELVALFKCLPSHGRAGCSIQYSCDIEGIPVAKLRRRPWDE